MYQVRVLHVTTTHVDTGNPLSLFAFIGFIDSDNFNPKSYVAHVPFGNPRYTNVTTVDHDFYTLSALTRYLRSATGDSGYYLSHLLLDVEHAQNATFIWYSLIR
jgi:hypothetical protein